MHLQLSWLLSSTVTPVSLLVTLLYWAVVHQDGRDVTFRVVNVHVINLVLVVLDVLLTPSRPVRLLHAYMPTAFGWAWIAFSAVYWRLAGPAHGVVYPLMDWGRPGTAVGVAVGVTVLLQLAHLAYFGLYKLLTRRLKPRHLSPVTGGSTRWTD